MRIPKIRKGSTYSRWSLSRKILEVLPGKPVGRVLDVGGKHAPYQAAVRCRRYLCLDMDWRRGPDVVGDAHALPFRDGAYDLVISTQTLEHCRDPGRVVEEVHRVLSPEGTLIVSVPFIYVIHGDPADFWRFTDQGLAHLLRPFASVRIWPLGNRWTALWDLVASRPSILKYLNYLVVPLSPLSRPNPRCPHGYLAVAAKGGKG